MGLSADGLTITPYLYSWAYYQEAPSKKHTYWVTFNDQSITVRADSLEEARKLAAHYLRLKNYNHPSLLVKELK